MSHAGVGPVPEENFTYVLLVNSVSDTSDTIYT